MATQIPSIGRIVHYVSRGSLDGKFPPVHRAAIITDVNGGTVSLCVINPTGIFFDIAVQFDEAGKAPGTWHWPEYVPEVQTMLENKEISLAEAKAYLKLTEEE